MQSHGTVPGPVLVALTISEKECPSRMRRALLFIKLKGECISPWRKGTGEKKEGYRIKGIIRRCGKNIRRKRL